jgi:hypothetical protein
MPATVWTGFLLLEMGIVSTFISIRVTINWDFTSLFLNFSCGDSPLHCADQSNTTYGNLCQPPCGPGFCCSKWGL